MSFLQLPSLNLIDGLLKVAPFLMYLNHRPIVIIHSVITNFIVFFLFVYLTNTLYGKPVSLVRFTLCSFAYTLIYQAVIFGVYFALRNITDIALENWFSAYPPYFIYIFYFLFTKILGINKTRCVMFVQRTYSLALCMIIIFYVCQVLTIYVFSNSSEYRFLVLILANQVTQLVAWAIYIVSARVIKMRMLWLDGPANFICENASRQLLYAFVKAIPLYLLVGACTTLLLPIDNIVLVLSVLTCAMMLCATQFLCGYRRDRIAFLQSNIADRDLHIRSLVEAVDGFRVIKHDIANLMQVYDGYIRTNNYTGLQQYHHSLFVLTKEAGDMIDISRRMQENPALYALLSSKLNHAIELGMHLNISAVANTSRIHLHPVDLIRMLGILLDNAIEATDTAERKTIHVTIDPLPHNRVLFAISNPTNDDVDMNRIMLRGYTTKPGHEGVGLYEVQQLIDCTACNLQMDYSDRTMSIYLEVPLIPVGLPVPEIASMKIHSRGIKA